MVIVGFIKSNGLVAGYGRPHILRIYLCSWPHRLVLKVFAKAMHFRESLITSVSVQLLGSHCPRLTRPGACVLRAKCGDLESTRLTLVTHLQL